METPRFLVGYARVSTQGQTLDAQLDQLRAAGCVAVFAEKAGGANVRQRPELAKALDTLPIGGVLAVTRLDRLGRNISARMARSRRQDPCRRTSQAAPQPGQRGRVAV